MAKKFQAGLSTSLSVNVYEAALQRIRWLFEEFDGDVAVSNSGGKDSTVVVELAAMVAKERGELPLRVTFLDQECEFQGTVDYQRYLMYERDDIDFHWYQIPFVIDNSTNSSKHWQNVWGEGEEWVREKEPDTFHENTFGHKFFYDLLSEINYQTAACVLSGMRAEESPTRRMAMTSRPVYKWVTWGSYAMGARGKKNQRFRFHPIYDWRYQDVWKFIHDHDIRYNEIYDLQYRHGTAIRDMRVSNYHHETSLSHLSYLQEAEPATWEAATRRLEGLSTYGQIGDDQMPKTLPYMFRSWDEYATYLIDNLVSSEEDRAEFFKHREKLVKSAEDDPDGNGWGRMLARSVIGGDVWGTTIENYINNNRKTQATRDREAEELAQKGTK